MNVGNDCKGEGKECGYCERVAIKTGVGSLRGERREPMRSGGTKLRLHKG